MCRDRCRDQKRCVTGHTGNVKDSPRSPDFQLIPEQRHSEAGHAHTHTHKHTNHSPVHRSQGGRREETRERDDRVSGRHRVKSMRSKQRGDERHDKTK